MKKMLLYALFCMICLSSYGQLRGSFNYSQDGHIYLALSNPTGYQNTFTNDPNANWVWEKGERFAVTCANGQTEDRTCPETDMALRNKSNPSNSSYGNNWIAIKVKVSKCRGFGGSLCSCKVYKGYKRAGLDQYKGSCTNYAGGHKCGHGPAAHGLSEYK